MELLCEHSVFGNAFVNEFISRVSVSSAGSFRPLTFEDAIGRFLIAFQSSLAAANSLYITPSGIGTIGAHPLAFSNSTSAMVDMVAFLPTDGLNRPVEVLPTPQAPQIAA